MTNWFRLKRAFLPNRDLFKEEAFLDRVAVSTCGMASIGTISNGIRKDNNDPIANAFMGGFVGGFLGVWCGVLYPWPLLVIVSGCIGKMRNSK